MSVQAPASPRLNHYFYEVPEKTAASLNRKALAFSVLEKISWVAFVAIIAAVFTVSYAGIAMAGNLPLVMVGMALASPILALAASQLHLTASGYAKRAAIEESVAKELRAIADWGPPQIQNFFQENGLRAGLPHLYPFSLLLPLIARFKFLDNLRRNLETSSREKLAHSIERDIAQSEVRLGKPIEENHKRLIRLANRQIAWTQHEHEAIPRALDAAVMLHIIENPTLELGLTDIGQFLAKTFEERKFDQEFEPRNDDYFRFHPSLNRRPITLAEIEQNMEPSVLRIKLFPRSGPARRQ